MCFLPSKSTARDNIHLLYIKISLTKTYFIKCKLKAAAGGVGAPSADTIRKRKRRAEAKERKEENKKRQKLLREAHNESIQAGINTAAVLPTNGEIYAPSAPIP